MAFIRYKVVNNKTYAYEITSYWDQNTKRSRQKSKYLGPVDPTTNEITKFVKKSLSSDNLILDFGDAYFLNEVIRNSEIYKELKYCFFDDYDALLPLIIYRLCSQSAMYNCEEWFTGSVLQFLHKNINLTSQRISELFSKLGDELVQRTFFKKYLSLVEDKDNSVIIDATSLPNDIQVDFNEWGRSDGHIEKQFRLLCVISQKRNIPLFYRQLPGNIVDVSTLQTTILELKEMGVSTSFALLDAGYFSEANIKSLYDNDIHFLSRMPAGRKIYKRLILEHVNGIEQLENSYMYGDRSYFAKSLEVDLYGKKAYACIVMDPHRKAKELQTLVHKHHGDKNERDKEKDALNFLSAGVMILVSSKLIPTSDILSTYYLRQSIEQIFGFSKSDLGLLPIRNHNNTTVKGYLFFQFLLLIFYLKIRDKCMGDYTVEKLLLILRKVKCKVYDCKIIPSELNKKQRLIFEQNNILVPKFSGI